jgi:hypothetical protein
MNDDVENIQETEVIKETAISGQLMPLSQEKYIPGNAYSKLKRELTEEDLESPPVRKLLLSDLDKCEMRIDKLERYYEEYHRIDKEKNILDERIKGLTSINILYSFCLAIGSILIGLSNRAEKEFALYLFSLGVLLIGAGLFTRYIKK